MRHRTKGYSLFEVLIAFVILTSVLAVLLPAQSALLSRSAKEQAHLLALDWAISLTQLAGTTLPLEAGEQDISHGDWRATVSVASHPTLMDLMVVKVRVRETATARDLAEIQVVRPAP